MSKNYLQPFTATNGVAVKVNPRSDGGLTFSAKGYTKLVLKSDPESNYYLACCPQISGTGSGLIKTTDQLKAARIMLRNCWGIS